MARLEGLIQETVKHRSAPAPYPGHGPCSIIDSVPPMNKQLTEWLRLVRAEYQEMPGMNLTKPQVQRLWGFDEVTCTEVLDTLEAEHILQRTEHDGYILADSMK